MVVGEVRWDTCYIALSTNSLCVVNVVGILVVVILESTNCFFSQWCQQQTMIGSWEVMPSARSIVEALGIVIEVDDRPTIPHL